MAGYENRQEQAQGRAEVTIKFGKGLMGEPFTSKNGKELVEIKIPNADHSDSRPWESFVVPANFVHENQYGKGMWMKFRRTERQSFPEMCWRARILRGETSGAEKVERLPIKN